MTWQEDELQAIVDQSARFDIEQEIRIAAAESGLDRELDGERRIEQQIEDALEAAGL